jgi:hypothetical protein
MKLPFNIMLTSAELKERLRDETRTNPDSGKAVTLPLFAAKVYDRIKELEKEENYELVQLGSDWFSRNFTKEYYVLLD